MLSNYFKIAWRSIWNNKIYSFVNISGLAVGLTVVMLIVLYVQDDLTFDRFHANEGQIYRIVQDQIDGTDQIRKMGNTGFIQGPTFTDEIAEIGQFCRLKNGWNTIVKKGKEGLEEQLVYVDPSFFSMFSFEVLAGSTSKALTNPDQVVITDKTALKYFGSANPVGQIMEIGDEGAATFETFEVVAVVKSPPTNSTLQFDLLQSIERIIPTDPAQRTRQSNWYNAHMNTFVQLHPAANATEVATKLNQAAAKHIAESRKIVTTTRDIQFHLQPLAAMHLDSEYNASNGLEFWSDAWYPKVLSGMGLAILLIACINFINLSLARSLRRTKEIGVRKVSGSTRTQVMWQFMTESFLMAALAFMPALALAYGAVPAFSKMMDKPLESDYLLKTSTLALFGGLLLLVTFLSGIYPSLVVSRFNPIKSLKGESQVSKRNVLGQSLVVLQFALAGLLLVGTLVANEQFKFIAQADLGYRTENIVRFWLPWDQIRQTAGVLKAELSNLAAVEKVSGKSGDWNSTKFQINGTETAWVYYEHIDENHLQLLDIPLVEGRYLSYQYTQDTVSNILVNEDFVRTYLKPDQDPFVTPIRQRDATLQIVGIVKDFHYASLKEKIKPMMWMLDDGSQAGCVHVQFAEGKEKEGLATIQGIYKNHVPFLPMEYFFLDDFRMQKYDMELRWKKVLDFAALFAMMVACLGLFGMVTFMTEQRVKEIGIRKVLGASVLRITALLSKDFLRLVLFALVIAVPTAYYFLDSWLANFAYRVDVRWWMFAAAGTLPVIIALLTVSFQSIKAALADPVKSLRSE